METQLLSIVIWRSYVRAKDLELGLHAYLNMSDPTHLCPPGFRLYTTNGVRACGRPPGTTGGCQAQVYFTPPSNGYKDVYSKVIGYQCGSTNGFLH